MAKGRNCSLDYILKKDWAEKSNSVDNEVIYVIGGLYGNFFALEKIKDMAATEMAAPLLIFNGDIHWFDVQQEDFLTVENLIKEDKKLLGNVEYELVKDGNELGCGCNYPEDVADGIVERSNIIHSMMKRNIIDSNILNEIRLREKTMVIEAFRKKIAITHGDEKNMAGWLCSIDNLGDKNRQEQLEQWLSVNGIDILATTHTCLPVIKDYGSRVVINNGAAGMANVKNETFGLVTRIAKTASKSAIVSSKVDDVFVELVRIDFDIESFISWFDKVWTENSPASISYRNRIVNGTNLTIEKIKIV